MGASHAQAFAGGQSWTRYGLESNEANANVDVLWQNYLQDPIHWWDNSRSDLHLRSSDLRHKITVEALWTEDCNPQWATQGLQKQPLFTRVRSESFAGERRQYKVLGLKEHRQNEHSWMALISQHVKCGRSSEALKTYEEMRKDGAQPSPNTFITLLKACTILRDLYTTKRIHADAITSGFGSDIYVGTMLVDVYAKCGSLVDARDVFEKMPLRDAVSWTAMILGYGQMDKAEEALQLYTRMQQEGVEPDARTYVGVLKACSKLSESKGMKKGDSNYVKERCLQMVTAIHADIKKAEFESDVFVGNMLVDAYAKCGSLEDARLVFEKMCRRDVVSWNAMILGYSQMDRGEEALQLYTRMQTECVVPDSWTYVSVLKGCGRLAELQERGERDGIAVKERCLETVRSIHRDVRKGKSESSLFVGNVLVDVYRKCGSLEDARGVFEKMPRRDVVSWNALVLGYAQMDKGEEALQLYTRMQQEGVEPDSRTYVSALKACSSLAGSEDGSEGERVAVNQRCLHTVRAIHASVRKAKLEKNVFVGTMLVDAYAKCGSVEEARRIFESMSRRDVVSWTALIVGYAQVDKGEVALLLYSQMQQEGVVPDGRTYVGALNACGSLAGLEKGKEIHSQILKAGSQVVDSFVADSLIDMYGKCGSMVDALQAFEAMPRRTTVAWNTLISGYAHLGESDLVFDLFLRMEQEGAQPNGLTFLGVLTACSHVGLVEKGQSYFMLMSGKYGITPTIKHFTCVIDLLGRAGHLAKATEMVRTMPWIPNSAVWRCMLAACRKWGDVELGRHAFECAVRLNRDDAAIYVLMSNIYAAAHMREEANAMQAMRVKLGAWKQPGQSRWTDLQGITHIFAVADRGHPSSQDIHAKLVEDLLPKMKKLGYVPHLDSVLRDIPEDEKEGALCRHSERMAIAYALLRTPEGTTIRVVKNLRVCEDCHRATALIATIEQRTIICRDATRFHVFKDGKCSCGGYW